MGLLTDGSRNAKTAKMSKELGITNAILHFAPARESGHQVCPMASAGCAAACLYTAGHGRYDSVKAARIARTQKFFNDPAWFTAELAKEIAKYEKKAAKLNHTCAIRLNGTSDVRWERYPVTYDGIDYENLMLAFPNVTFYDYTKIPNRRNIPENYHLTFSLSENNDSHALAALESGMNVAVVFKPYIPEKWYGKYVIDGDKHDFRFLDPQGGQIIGLKAKGDALKDRSGFVRGHDDEFDTTRKVVVAWQKVA